MEGLNAQLNIAIQNYTDHIRLQVTQELLATTFALGDGVVVTWGEATVAQHEQRISLLTKNAAGNLEAAARHRSAVQEIQKFGVLCLNALPG
jgi:putative heme degradation protein